MAANTKMLDILRRYNRTEQPVSLERLATDLRVACDTLLERELRRHILAGYGAAQVFAVKIHFV